MSKPISTPERILEAATELMWRDGYDAVSVDTICYAANVRKGSFYHAFHSKEELLNALILRRWNIARPELEQIYATDETPLEKLRNHLEWFGITQRGLAAKYGFVPGVFNMAVGINAPQSTRDLIALHRSEHAAMFTHAIQSVFADKGIDEAMLKWQSMIVSQLVNGATIEARLSNTLEPYEHLPESVLAVLGLGEPPTSRFRKQH